MSSRMNGKPMAEGHRNYAALPAGPMRRGAVCDPRPLPPERVRELMAGCYQNPNRQDKRLVSGRNRAERAAKLVRRLGTVRAAARCLRMTEKATYRLLSFYGFDVKELRRAAA